MNSSASIVFACASCGAKNRVPARHLADTGRCGSCKNALPPASEPIEADENLFDAIVSTARVPVFVDFWAAWCGPCRMVAPEVHRLAHELKGQALVVKVDTEANPQLAARFRIQSIPGFVILQSGQIVSQHSGAVPHSEMRRWLLEASTLVR